VAVFEKDYVKNKSNTLQIIKIYIKELYKNSILSHPTDLC